MFLINNPEFKKNLWLELSPGRLILMPLILGAVFFINYLLADDLIDFLNSIKSVSSAIFIGLIFLWGSKQVSESVISEVNENTWDFQRMTCLDPGDMAAGKLFGSTIYPWYGAGFCAAAYLLSAFRLPDFTANVKFLLVLILAGVLCHAVILSSTLMGIRKYRTREKINSSFYFIGAVGVFICVLPTIMTTSYYNKWDMDWYMFHFSYSDFAMFSISFFLIWSLIGLYRNMRTELQIVNGPWVWMLFLISLMVWVSGLTANLAEMDMIDRFTLGLYLSYGIGLFITCLMEYSESKDIVDFRLILDKIRKKQWKEAVEIFPLWLLTLIISLIIFLVICMLSFISHGVDIPGQEIHISALYCFNILCFILRDLSLVIYLNLKENSQRADIAAAIYVLILYLLVPIMIGLSDLDILLPVFVPAFDSNFMNGTLPVFIQFIFMFYLVSERWKSRTQSFQEG